MVITPGDDESVAEGETLAATTVTSNYTLVPPITSLSLSPIQPKSRLSIRHRSGSDPARTYLLSVPSGNENLLL